MISRRTDLFKEYWYRLPSNLQRIGSVLNRLSDLQQDSRLAFCRPGLRYGLSPIKGEASDSRSWFDRLIFRGLSYRDRHQYTELNASEWLRSMALRKQRLIALTPLQLDANRAALVQQMRLAQSTDDILDDALAHAVIAVEKTRLLVPRTNQMLAARAMLHGHFVEMATGEGKTLSIALAAGAAALSATPVHVLTANDYLASRDACYLEPVYQFLGLRVASAVADQEPAVRRQAYSADIVYVTAKQVAFDWLNDTQEQGSSPDSLKARLAVLTRLTPRQQYSPLLRGLCLAIVDEADSLLVDEARIPLVLAATQSVGTAEETESVIALGLAEQLREDIDYSVQSNTRLVQLTDNGRRELSILSGKVAHVWQSSRYREERVGQALTALHRFARDRDYIVRDGRLELMDAHTGRSMPDRRLPHGLHRLLEPEGALHGHTAA